MIMIYQECQKLAEVACGYCQLLLCYASTVTSHEALATTWQRGQSESSLIAV